MLLRPSSQAMAAKLSHLYLKTFSRYFVCWGGGGGVGSPDFKGQG